MRNLIIKSPKCKYELTKTNRSETNVYGLHARRREALMTKAVSTSATSVNFYATTRRNIPEH